MTASGAAVVVLYCTVFISTLENGNLVLGCATGWTSQAGGCFKYFSVEKDWLSAQLHCIQEGGNVAKYDDPSQRGIFTGKESPAWIGVVIAGVNWDNPQWFDGSAASPTYWAVGEPSDTSVSCVVEDNNGEWLTVPCSTQTGFICREGFLQADTTRLSRATDYIIAAETTCPWDSSPYAVFYPPSGYCYGFLSSGVTASLNSLYCPSFNGVVIGIVNEEENKFLTAKIVNNFAAYAGAWLDTSQTSYSNWLAGEPDEETGCFGLFLSAFGAWQDQDCNLNNMPVACRINPPDTCSDDTFCVHGVCRDGACICGDGWSAASADTKCTVCTTDEVCEHGTCVSGACSCNSPWVIDPSTSTCMTVWCTNDSQCGQGTCQASVCSCNENWQISETDYKCSVNVGTATEQPTTCLGSADCVHGTCNVGACSCDTNWTYDVDGKCTECTNDQACVHGVCSSGTCDCSQSWYGFNAATRDCTEGTQSTIFRGNHRRSGLFHLIPGGALVGHPPLANIQTSGIIQCAHSCVEHTACYSFNYDNGAPALGSCELFDNIYDTGDLAEIGDLQYFKVDVIT
ncbi:neurogenic locus notch homolog protein-like [Ptychodera flava]|uniref:neurogenic locus notch homolog protein-like n=1 Tax=Ptychodera flava TaxID=63121 RepID=UPI00396A8485